MSWSSTLAASSIAGAVAVYRGWSPSSGRRQNPRAVLEPELQRRLAGDGRRVGQMAEETPDTAEELQSSAFWDGLTISVTLPSSTMASWMDIAAAIVDLPVCLPQLMSAHARPPVGPAARDLARARPAA